MSSLQDAFKAMAPEHQAMVRDKVMDGRRSPQAWLELLAPLAQYDVEADAARKRLGKRLWLVIISGLVLAFVAVFVFPLAAVAVLVATVVAVLVTLPAYRFAKNMNLHNGPLDFAVPLMPILGEDVDPAQPVDMRLDLRGPLVDAKRKGESQPYQRGAYYKIVDTYYEDPWLSGSARFVDGAALSWAATDLVTSQKKTKRNPRGKIKTKVKRKKRTSLEVSVTFPAKNYAQAPVPAGPPREVRKQAVKPGEDRTTVKLSRVVKSVGTEQPLDPQHFIDLVATAYERVEPARRKKL